LFGTEDRDVCEAPTSLDAGLYSALLRTCSTLL
jgi:hypothetical protein